MKSLLTIAAIAYCSMLSLAQPGTILSDQKISDTEGSFTAILDNSDRFGESVENIGDLNDDGVTDLAVGAVSDDDGASSAGAVYILFMNTDGTVASHQKISALDGGFTGYLSTSDRFGSSIAALGDLNGDGVEDIAVGAIDDTGGVDMGAVYILFLNTDGTVASHQMIAQGVGGFGGDLTTSSSPSFGISTSAIGDLDGDGITELAVGAYQDDDGGANRGAVWILFLNTDGTVSGEQKISSLSGGFAGPLIDSDTFGWSVEGIGDLNGDTVEDLAVGARFDNDGGTSRGAIWILFLNTDGTVGSAQKISSTAGGFAGPLINSDFFGQSIANLGDLNSDGITDLAVGARGDDDGGSMTGAVWVLFMNTDGTVNGQQKVSAISGGISGPLDPGDEFGFSCTGIGDLDGDGRPDMAIGARYDDDGGSARGAVWITFLDDCQVNSAFTASDVAVCQDVVVDFTNTSVNTGTVSFDWLQDGSSVATTTDLSQSFGSGGSFLMELVTMKTNCTNDTSSVTIDVTPTTFNSFSITVCDHYTVPSGDETYLASGIYTDTIPNTLGCDSIMTIDVTISTFSTSSFAVSSCGTYTVPSGDETYSVSGVYMDTIPGAFCDSVMTIDVTIGSPTTSSFAVSNCNNYTVPSGDEAYLVSGTYMDTIPNMAGCDSVMTIDVTITSPTTSTFSVSNCDSYTVPSGDETYTLSGTYNDTIPNTAGCDSVMTINVTIGGETTASISVSECDQYTVPSGDETYMVSGTYMDTIPNTTGCDSVITINLTITPVDTSVMATATDLTANATGATYQWIDCSDMSAISGETDANFTPQQNGSYAVIVTEGGCTDTSACYTFSDLGVNSLYAQNIRVYPNPTNGTVNVNLGQEFSDVHIRLTDVSGRILQDEHLLNAEIFTLNIEYESGIYLLEISTPEGNISTIRLVKR